MLENKLNAKKNIKKKLHATFSESLTSSVDADKITQFFCSLFNDSVSS